jgi:hypothetical protein
MLAHTSWAPTSRESTRIPGARVIPNKVVGSDIGTDIHNRGNRHSQSWQQTFTIRLPDTRQVHPGFLRGSRGLFGLRRQQVNGPLLREGGIRGGSEQRSASALIKCITGLKHASLGAPPPAGGLRSARHGAHAVKESFGTSSTFRAAQSTTSTSLIREETRGRRDGLALVWEVWVCPASATDWIIPLH